MAYRTLYPAPWPHPLATTDPVQLTCAYPSDYVVVLHAHVTCAACSPRPTHALTRHHVAHGRLRVSRGTRACYNNSKHKQNVGMNVCMCVCL